MNHERITKLNLIDQYVLGQLAEHEAEEFEAHFVDCAECIEQLKISRSFIDELKTSSVAANVRSIDDRPIPRPSWLMGQFKPVRLAAAAALIIAVVAGFLGVRRLNRLETQVRQARQETAEINDRYQRERAAAAESAQKDQQDKQVLVQQVGELQRKLDQANASAGPVPPAGRGPDGATDDSDVNYPFFALFSVTRGSAPDPVNVALTNTTPSFGLSVPIEDGQNYSTYRIKIVNGSGKTVWNRNGFRLDGYHALSLRLNSSVVPSGSYTLSVEGLTASGQWTTVGNYPFRVTRTAHG